MSEGKKGFYKELGARNWNQEEDFLINRINLLVPYCMESVAIKTSSL